MPFRVHAKACATCIYRKDSPLNLVAQVTLPDGRDLGDILLAEGLAVPFVG